MCDWQDSRLHGGNLRRLQSRLKVEAEYGCNRLIEQAIRQLDEYFEGSRRSFDLPLRFEGTEFQRLVWQQMLIVPYGETVSYKSVAVAIGRPTAVRAVAAAIGQNPLSVIVPCHRVVGVDGSLTGYAGGLAAKSALLRLERPQSHNLSM